MSSDMPHLDANRSKWDRRSATLDESAFGYLRVIQQKTIEAINLEPGVHLLDVGCGTGWAVRQVADRLESQGEFYGIDLSPRMIETAQDNAQGIEHVHFLEANAEEMPLDDGQFDVIICTNSFHHYPNPPAALAEFRRVLKPGGKAHIVDVASDEPLVKLIDRWVKSREREHVHFYTTPEIEALFAPAGLCYLGSRSIMGPVKMHSAEK